MSPPDLTWGRTWLVLGHKSVTCLQSGAQLCFSRTPQQPPPPRRSPQETSCSPGLIARIAHSIFLILSFSFSFSPAASCEGLSGSGLEALGLEAAGTGKTGLGLEQDRGTTSAHPSSPEPFSHPFCSSARSAMVVKPFLKPQCDLGVFPSSSHPSYLDLGPSSQPCLAVRIWP